MSHLDFAPTPPMGWNSWDSYGASVREDEVKANADYLAANLKEYGWEYVVVDIQWSEPTATSMVYHQFTPLCMDEYSRLIPAVNRFPSAVDGQGFKPLGDYIHSLGLKFGIHIMRGIPRQAVQQNTAIKGTNKRAREIALNNICAWNSDMYGVDVSQVAGQQYYDSLFELYASWGVDFIKVDDICDSQLYHDAHRSEIQAIHDAIAKTGRPIVLSLSPGPAALKNGYFFQNTANMWRLTDDFWDNWKSLRTMFDRAAEWAPFVRPGNWPDCDMLPLGHLRVRADEGNNDDNWTHFTKAEQYLLMSLWTISCSPLMYGGTLPDLDDFTKSLLTNRAVLKMHREVNECREVYRDKNWIGWQASSEMARYLAFFNISEQTQVLPQQLKQLAHTGQARDLWREQSIDWHESQSISAHGVLLVEENKVG
ncbi:glycoside hydrolase family 27 protein [Lapidilactobacillus luobeiensis]|uniref:glycoside hydrolase family 27 protein n=1 Tax=Lapidilactobacillus luobeiensis TaxID=2950371 RepID=UPI0021C349BF|nr:glycoside hydrolase family 27 protein [Lapidilactobacillus luobeiensis]